MTDDFDRSLRDRLAAIADAVPVNAPRPDDRVRDVTVRTGSAGRRLAIGGLFPLVAIVLVGTVLAGLATLGPPSPSRTANPSAAVVGPVESTAKSGDFELTISSGKARYSVDEPIEISAALTYRGAGEATIRHAQGASVAGTNVRRPGGPIGFGIVEPVLGDLHLGPGWRESCESSTLQQGEPLTIPFEKSGGWSNADPRSAEYGAFIVDPVLRLSEGTWHVYAVAEFSIQECSPDVIRLRAEIEIQVLPAPAITNPPATNPAATPGPLTSVGGVEATATDGTFQVRIASPKATWLAGEPIDVFADLTYVGADAEIEIGSSDPFMVFNVTQLDGPHRVGGGAGDVCKSTTLRAGVPSTVGFAKGGGYSADDPDIDWLKAYTNDRLFRLTPGTWQISAFLEAFVPSCDGTKQAFRTDIVIEVVDATAVGGTVASATVGQIDWASGILRDYAALHPESFAALWVDRPYGGPARLGTSWTRDLEVHQAWLQEHVGSVVPFALYKVDYTAEELERARANVDADLAWLDSLPAQALGFGVDGWGNRLQLEVSSALADAPVRIREHYATKFGFDPAMFVVTSDGTGATFVPWGTVRVTLSLPAGGIPEGYELMPGWKSDVYGLRCGHGDVGVGFEDLPCQEGHWTILVQRRLGDGDWTTVASGEVDVVAGKTVELAIDVNSFD